MHSALLFIRSQPLEKGDVVRLAAYPSAQAYLVEVEVLGREKVSAAGQKWPAIKMALRLRQMSRTTTTACSSGSRRKSWSEASGWR
jgi:hypothetical protein